MNRFYDIAELDREEINHLLKLSDRLLTHPEPRALEGKVLSLLFLSPSLRTLASFQSAMTRLGGGTFVVSPESSIHKLESRSGIVMDGMAAEHIKEAIPVIAAYGDAMGIRAFARRENLQGDLEDQAFHAMGSLVNTPLINMESAMAHPCQSLADWKTMDELAIPSEKGKFVLCWTWHPQAMPYAVAASTLNMAASRGMDVTIAHPEFYELPETIVSKAGSIAKNSGGSVKQSSDLESAISGAHVIYANSWSSQQHYGDSQSESELKAHLRHWRVEDKWFETTQPDCRFMHPLPVRREVNVTESVLDGPRSIVIGEAKNRMAVQMAILHEMLA